MMDSSELMEEFGFNGNEVISLYDVGGVIYVFKIKLQ